MNNIHLKRAIICLDPDTKLQSATQITREVRAYRGEAEDLIKESLPPDPVKVAIVLDCWSAPHREGYIAIKAYWITEKWTLAEALIGFEPCYGKHSGQALGLIVIQRLEHYGLTARVSALTSDNASNNKTLTQYLNAAIEWLCSRLQLSQQSSGIVQMPCLAHVIQLAVSELIKKMNIQTKHKKVDMDWDDDAEMEELKQMQGQDDENIYGVSW